MTFTMQRQICAAFGYKKLQELTNFLHTYENKENIDVGINLQMHNNQLKYLLACVVEANTKRAWIKFLGINGSFPKENKSFQFQQKIKNAIHDLPEEKVKTVNVYLNNNPEETIVFENLGFKLKCSETNWYQLSLKNKKTL